VTLDPAGTRARSRRRWGLSLNQDALALPGGPRGPAELYPGNCIPRRRSPTASQH
jgi:hypothetical protein